MATQNEKNKMVKEQPFNFPISLAASQEQSKLQFSDEEYNRQFEAYFNKKAPVPIQRQNLESHFI